jgi:purine-binding chemotaxis protein CheW
VDDVQTMVMLPMVSSIPNAPPHVRGVINLRGKVMPVIDMRIRLGMPSLKAETEKLISLLAQREQDHKNWINELEQSVKERREFKLTTNHHLCAFGKWYDTFKTDNLLLATLLKKFDDPHQRIHAIARNVISLGKANNLDAAYKIIDDTRNGDLAEMVRLFALLRLALQESLREIAVVLAAKEHTFAITVDSVETVSRLVEGTVDDIRNTGISFSENGLVTSVGKIDKSNKLVLVLDTASIFGTQDGIA